MLKLGILLTLSGVVSFVTFVCRFWIYDRCLYYDWRDCIKLILIILEIFKDIFMYLLLYNIFLN